MSIVDSLLFIEQPLSRREFSRTSFKKFHRSSTSSEVLTRPYIKVEFKFSRNSTMKVSNKLLLLKLFNFLVISTAFLQSTSCSDIRKVKIFSNALEAIIRDFYVSNSIDFDILASDMSSWNFASSVIENSAKIIHSGLVTLSYVDGSELQQINLTRSTIIFVGSNSFFGQIEEKIIMHNIDFMRVRHFVVIERADQFEGIFILKNSTFYVSNLLSYYERTKKIYLVQLLDSDCESAKMKAINEFSPISLKWKTNIFELDEPLRNLGNCSFIVKCDFCFDTRVAHKMFLLTILGILEQKLNFESTLVYGDRKSMFRIDIGTLSAAVSHNIYVFETVEYTLTFTTGEPYTPFEKLIIPFDKETWTAIVITFMLGFIVIFLVKKCHVGWQIFVFGSFVSTPAFNMAIAFFGQGQVQNVLPGRNFARYLLMLFILFCLVIRTGYQGVQFELIYQVSSN